MDILKDIYKKDIKREIQGIIKVEDETSIIQELEEYVLTEELQRNLLNFFEVYNNSINNNTKKIGVWISGFFGSGKSHFLKIISYLLENKKINNKHVIEYFQNKIKDKHLLELINQANTISTDVILFNIDSKSSLNNNEKDKILTVFTKVFNEKIGFSSIPHIAELERFLIKENKYQQFQEILKNDYNKNWANIRNDFYFHQTEIIKAYAKAINKSTKEVTTLFDKVEKQYDMSIEKLATQINEYLTSTNSEHHIVFLVDEIGQYIANNQKLMLNLQTMVENLGSRCQGKAWVIVTSQDTIDNTLKSYDFSKIQGRFDTKLSLSSSDIAEIIKLRLLEKNVKYNKKLELIYKKNQSIIKNLLTFTNHKLSNNYETVTSFIQTYPFIPYQFQLVQETFNNIRKEGYIGKHLSTGERSLLSTFQEVAKKYSNYEINTLIPFYAFYDVIESLLSYQIKNIIDNAKKLVINNKLEEIDLNLLKMLFMLKNITEFSTNIDNLSTLYISNIQTDKQQIKNEITKSLKKLEEQTLIEHINDEYIFLDESEQKINREIKNINLDANKINDYLKKIIFENIITENKFKYKNKTFSFTKYIDNQKYSKESEIGIKIITNLSNYTEKEIKLKSINEKQYAFIKLPISETTYDDIIKYLKVTEYCKNNNIEKLNNILKNKQQQIENNELVIIDNITQSLNTSDIIISGDTITSNNKDIITKIHEALEILIDNLYSKFYYINHNFTKKDINELFYSSTINNENPNQKAYDAIKEYCIKQTNQNNLINIKNIIQNFETIPYGFLKDDIIYLIIKLLKDNNIMLTYNNKILDITKEETLTKILNSNLQNNIIIKLNNKISIEIINNLNTLAHHYFNVKDLTTNENEIITDFKTKCLIPMKEQLLKIKNNYDSNAKYPYPDEEILDQILILLQTLIEKEDYDFISEITNQQNKIIFLLKNIENLQNFFNGVQKTQFDQTRTILLIYEDNQQYLDDQKILKTVNELIKIMTNKQPYNEIYKLPSLRNKLNTYLAKLNEKKLKKVINQGKQNIKCIKNEIKIYQLKDKIWQKYITKSQTIIEKLTNLEQIKDIYASQAKLTEIKEEFNDKLKQKNIIQLDNLIETNYPITTKEDIEKYLAYVKNKLLKNLEKK